MKEDYTLIKKYHHNFRIYLFSFFSPQHNNIIKIIITINSEHFLNLKKFHIFAQNNDRSIEKEYNYNVIKNESQLRYSYKSKF
jgi:hypothetical protein